MPQLLPFLPFLGQVGNSIQSYANSNLQNKANLAQSQQQFAMGMHQWNLQNEYNSPKNQMSRLKEAGLNPYLMYGMGNVGNASTPPQYQKPEIDYSGRRAPDLGLAMEQHQDIQMKSKQMEATDSVINLNNARMITELLRPEYLRGLMGLNISRTVGQGYQNEIGYSKSKQELINQMNKEWDWSNQTHQKSVAIELSKGSLDVVNAGVRNIINNLNKSFQQYSQPFNKKLKELEYKHSRRNYRQQFIRPWAAPAAAAGGAALKFIK